MPKATRYSPSYERRHACQYGSSSSSSPPSSSISHSMRYLRGRVSSSLASPQSSPPPVGIAAESYLRLKKKGALTTWSTRYLVLRGAQLVWFHSKQDAQSRRGVQEILYVETGRLTTLRSHELGLAIKTSDGKEFVARAFDRSDLAKWITAFQRLALKREAKLAAGGRLSETFTADSTATGDLSESELEVKRKERMTEPEPAAEAGGRHVSFHHSVLVRTIPTVSDDQIADLYYTRAEMERFSARASSLLSRTEEAVSCAYLAIRRPGSLSCRRTQVA